MVRKSISPERQRRRKSGLRFSATAFEPSLASSVRKIALPLVVTLLALIVVACSDGSKANCDGSDKRRLVSDLEKAHQSQVAAEAEVVRVGPLTVRNGDAYGVAMIRRETASLNVQIARDELARFADSYPACFTADERAQLVGS